MNRVIKFRGLRTDGKGWVVGFYRKNTFYNKLGDEPKEIYTKHFIGAFNNLELFDRLFEQVEVHPETVSQFTGLPDKNGVEIYEGDIVYCEKKFYSTHKAIVKWLDNRCAFYFVAETIGTDLISREPYLSAYKINSFKVEVIGNLHEHKHLLV